MNIREFQLYMQSPPQTPHQKYIFFVNDENLAANIAYCGYGSQAILDKPKEGFFTADSFIGYMNELDRQLLEEGRGTDRIQYVYVLSCSKWNSDRIEQCLRENSLPVMVEWKLFKDKDYLSRVDRLDDLKKILNDFYERKEGPSDDSGGRSLERFHEFNARGEPIGILDREIVEYLIGKVPMFVFNGTPYLYEHGVYVQDSMGHRAREMISSLMERKFHKEPLIRRVYDLLIDQPSLQKSYDQINLQPKHWINFQNGYFDVMTWKMLPHDPKYLTINQIPHSFNPMWEIKREAGKAMTSFLKVSLPDLDDQETFWEYLGYSMTNDTCFQKFVMIKGPGGTGKSVLISLVEDIIGRENCVNISIQDLNKRFYATSLFGMLLNACADIPSSAMQSVDVLKKAVGEDPLLYEKKGRDPMKFFSYAKLLFSANEMPMNLDDKTNAYYRRLLVLTMDHIVTPEEKDTGLREKLFHEEDFCIFRAMTALKALYDRGSFLESEKSREAIDDLYRSADSVKAFLDDCVENKRGSMEKRSDVYEAYFEYCRENGRQAHGKSIFFRKIKDKGIMLKRTSSGIFYLDIRLRNPDESYLEDIADSDQFLEPGPDEDVPFEDGKTVKDGEPDEQKISCIR